MYRTFFFLIGFLLVVIGSTYIIAYLNLLTMGYSFVRYLAFIGTRVECLGTLLGIVLILFCVLTKGDASIDLYL